jgi:hypothetical protein
MRGFPSEMGLAPFDLDNSSNCDSIQRMKRSSRALPKGGNQLAVEIVRISPEEPQCPQSIKEYLAEIGRKGGIKGGRARAEKLTAKRRSEIAQQAARKRWRKKT